MKLCNERITKIITKSPMMSYLRKPKYLLLTAVTTLNSNEPPLIFSHCFTVSKFMHSWSIALWDNIAFPIMFLATLYINITSKIFVTTNDQKSAINLSQKLRQDNKILLFDLICSRAVGTACLLLHTCTVKQHFQTDLRARCDR